MKSFLEKERSKGTGQKRNERKQIMEDFVRNIQKELFAMQDLQYREFHSRLMPMVEKERIIGVRTPELRKYAGKLGKRQEAEDFLAQLPHFYYEENNLHGFLIEKCKDYDRCVVLLDAFLPYIDNWATCDMVRPKVLKQDLPALFEKIREWTASGQTYTIRYGIGLLMQFYLEEAFSPEYPELVSGIRSEEYYVNMMIAWYFATALAKQPEAILPYLEERRLPEWVHRKTIQKAIESNRITREQKAYLRTLRVR